MFQYWIVSFYVWFTGPNEPAPKSTRLACIANRARANVCIVGTMRAFSKTEAENIDPAYLYMCVKMGS